MRPSNKETIVKNKVIRVKNHVVKHRAKYAVAATLTVCTVIAYRNAKALNVFLIENGIDPDTYWLTPEDLESVAS